MAKASIQGAVLTVDGFLGKAASQSLRGEFDARFADPRQADAGRFVWDYWHVPGQYTLLRTPAYHYFSQPLWKTVHARLQDWGRKNLGCHDISPPWMSCYVEGCHQDWHADLPHGPWAFVYSLTPWTTRRFEGGETLLLQEEILDYWGEPASGRGATEGATGGVERAEVIREVEPRFDRLTVFDPRIPHSVREVRGVRDPRQGRLVIHGWFVQPRPFVEGPLAVRSLSQALGELEPVLGQALSGAVVQGVLTLRLQVAPSGEVAKFQWLADRLKASGAEREAIPVLRRQIEQFFKTWKFAKARGASTVTIPLVFEASAG